MIARILKGRPELGYCMSDLPGVAELDQGDAARRFRPSYQLLSGKYLTKPSCTTVATGRLDRSKK